MPHAILAQSQDAVMNAIKEPGFGQWLVYLLVCLIVVDRVGGWVMRLRATRTEVSGQVETTPKVEYAKAAELAEVKRDVETLKKEATTDRTQTALAAETRLGQIREVIHSECAKVTSELHNMKDALQAQIREEMQHAQSDVVSLRERVATMEATVDAWRK